MQLAIVGSGVGRIPDTVCLLPEPGTEPPERRERCPLSGKIALE